MIGCLSAAAIVCAQKMDSFDSHVADYRLLMAKKVQVEVGLTEAQRAKLNSAAEHERTVAKPYLAELQKAGKDPATLSTDQKYLGFLMELRDNCLKVLTPSQLKRLGQLSLQSVDIGGVLDVVVAKKIGMSVPQLTKVRSIYGDSVKKSSAIARQVDEGVAANFKNVRVKTQAEAAAINERITKERTDGLKKRQPELDKIALQTKNAMQAVLTAKQLAAYKGLQGKIFAPK